MGSSPFNSSLKDTGWCYLLEVPNYHFNSSLKDTLSGWFFVRVLEAFNSSLKDTITMEDAESFQDTFNSSLKDTLLTDEEIEAAFDFQFLIKGYLDVLTHFRHHRLAAFDFQFLIKGYGGASIERENALEMSFNSSLKDTSHLALPSAPRHVAFNSSLKDTINSKPPHMPWPLSIPH